MGERGRGWREESEPVVSATMPAQGCAEPGSPNPPDADGIFKNHVLSCAFFFDMSVLYTSKIMAGFLRKSCGLQLQIATTC